MAIKATAFFDDRVQFDVDITQKSSRVDSDYRRKRLNFIILPVFLALAGSKGASEIVSKFTYNFARKFSIINITRNHVGSYCACVSWKPTAETIVRYKLWEGEGELLYVPLYTGQRIFKDFFIEIWNASSIPNVVNGSDKLYLSLLTLDTDKCENSDIDNNAATRLCTDLIFDLNNFNPNVGDYYNVVGDCGLTQLFKV